uniref:PH domain-containing protein n=1 Tax=Parastrongyloides trichosuri TaxID=131310 RepID=A0A0N4Z035_PARTI
MNSSTTEELLFTYLCVLFLFFVFLIFAWIYDKIKVRIFKNKEKIPTINEIEAPYNSNISYNKANGMTSSEEYDEMKDCEFFMLSQGRKNMANRIYGPNVKLLPIKTAIGGAPNVIGEVFSHSFASINVGNFYGEMPTESYKEFASKIENFKVTSEHKTVYDSDTSYGSEYNDKVDVTKFSDDGDISSRYYSDDETLQTDNCKQV